MAPAEGKLMAGESNPRAAEDFWTKGTASAVPQWAGLTRASAPEARFSEWNELQRLRKKLIFLKRTGFSPYVNALPWTRLQPLRDAFRFKGTFSAASSART